MSYNVFELSAWLIASFKNPDDWAVERGLSTERIMHRKSKLVGVLMSNKSFLFDNVRVGEDVAEAANKMLDEKFKIEQNNYAGITLNKLRNL